MRCILLVERSKAYQKFDTMLLATLEFRGKRRKNDVNRLRPMTQTQDVVQGALGSLAVLPYASPPGVEERCGL